MLSLNDLTVRKKDLVFPDRNNTETSFLDFAA